MRPLQSRERGAAGATSLGSVLDFLRLLWAVDHALRRVSKRMASTIGVTGPQRLVIRVIGRFPGISAGRLTEILHLHPSTLTGVLKRLEERRLIRREGDVLDGRRTLLRLTAKGERCNLDPAGTVEHSLQQALRLVSPADLMAAERVLRRLARFLNNRADGER